MGMENTQTQTQTPNQVKDPRAEFFKIIEVGKYKVYHRSRAVHLLKMSQEIEQYRPTAFANAGAVDYNRLLDWVIYNRPLNKAISQALKQYHINWEKMRKRIERYYEGHGKDWVLYCYKNRRLCVQIAVVGKVDQANNIIINVYYY